MVNTCQKFAAHKNLKFSTNPDPEKSKTKCIIFTKKEHEKLNVAPIMLNGDPLPWVGRVKHLGNILESSNLMNQDCSVKKGAFVGKINSLRQEFHSVDPEVQVNILNIYATSFYGSGLWDIFGSGCEGFYTAWNRAVRQIFNLPWTTHRYWIETISDSIHPKVMLCSRYAKFHKSLVTSKKTPVRFLSRLIEHDLRTVFGRTLSNIKSECKISSTEELTPLVVKQSMKYSDMPLGECWRTGVLAELLEVRKSQAVLGNFEQKEIDKMIDYLCTE